MLSGKVPLHDAKHIIWDQIAKEVPKMWDYVKVMENKRNIEIASLAEYEVAKQNMQQRPSKRDQHSINFLSFSSDETLKVIGVSDIYGIMGRARRFNEKKHLMDNVKAQDDQILKEFNQFYKHFIPMFDEGLPHFWDETKYLLSKGIYDGNLTDEKMNHQAFQDMDKSLLVILWWQS